MVNNFRHPNKKYLLALIIISLLVLFILYKPGFLENKILFYMPRLFENKALKMASTYWEDQGVIHVSDTLKKGMPFTKGTEGNDQDSIIRSEDKKPNNGDLGHLYYIIIGSFINSENANFAARQYQSQGYKTSIIRTTNRNGNIVELVSVKTFNNFDNAVKYLREVKSKVNSDAWIYPNP